MAQFGFLHRDGVELIVCRQSAASYPLHNHVSAFTLGLVLEGAVELVTGKGGSTYQEEGMFMVPPYVPHSIRPRSRYTLLNVCISKELTAEAAWNRAKPAVTGFLRDAVQQPAIEDKIVQALCRLSAVKPEAPARKDNALSGLTMRLEMYPERRCSLDDMARLTFTSKYQLIRSFKQEVGLTPHQFQIQNRIRMAQRLLRGSVPIAEAALATGFYDQSHFIRHFEKIVGLTPSEYMLACGAPTHLFAGQTSAGINLANR